MYSRSQGAVIRAFFATIIAGVGACCYAQQAQWYRVSTDTVVTPFTERIGIDWFVIIGNSVWFPREWHNYVWIDTVSGDAESDAPWTNYYQWLSEPEIEDDRGYSELERNFPYQKFNGSDGENYGMWIGPDEFYEAWIDYKGLMNEGDEFWFHIAVEIWNLRFPGSQYVIDSASRETGREVNHAFHEVVDTFPAEPPGDIT